MILRSLQRIQVPDTSGGVQMSDVSLALLIFGLTSLLIITERVHKAIVSLFGAALMIALGILTQDEAFYSHEFGLDYNVLFLLIGMMVIVNIVRETGLFEVLAIWTAQRSDAKPFRMLLLLAVITALLSAMLDNVTTVLLMAPVTLAITKRLQLNPVIFLLVEAMASNIGGTATLVGDPPNMMIASKAELGYLDFLIRLGPIVVIIMAVFLGGLWLFTGRSMQVDPRLRNAVLNLRIDDAVQDRVLLRRCIWLLIAVNMAFCAHDWLRLEPATIALLGASLFMLFGNKRETSGTAEELSYLTDVEWKTIFFFIGLFILIGGLVKVGIIRQAAELLVTYTSNNLTGTTMAVLWGSALLSAVVDNIPYVAAMNPLIVDLARSRHPSLIDQTMLVHQPDIMPLWWALALGACLGGNATIIGASANVIVVDLARKSGHDISFWQFARVGIPVTIGSMLLSSLYLWWLFL